jgi:hypothetical protein
LRAQAHRPEQIAVCQESDSRGRLASIGAVSKRRHGRFGLRVDDA